MIGLKFRFWQKIARNPQNGKIGRLTFEISMARVTESFFSLYPKMHKIRSTTYFDVIRPKLGSKAWGKIYRQKALDFTTIEINHLL